MVTRNISRLILLLMVILIKDLSAQVPQMISYQGYIEGTGGPLHGTYSILFSLYNGSVGGSALWSETQSVDVDNGVFDVMLGDVTILPYQVFDGADKYLGIKVSTDPEMTPRIQLASVGYAYKAHDSDELGGHDATSYVRKVDNVPPDGNGDVDLVAGSNITITPDVGNNLITIAATGGGGGGDITAVYAGTGLDGGGTTGDVTLDVEVPLELDHEWAGGGDQYAGPIVGNARGEYMGQPAHFREGKLGTMFGAVYGRNLFDGTWGYLGGQYGLLAAWGAYDPPGITSRGNGYIGGYNYGIFGKFEPSGNSGYIGNDDHGVYGSHSNGPYGYLGGSKYGIYGYSNFYLGGTISIWGAGVYGYHAGQGRGVVGYSASGYAGYFFGNGDVHMSGTVTKGGGGFKIDHPLDPANKYLYHSFVESPDMMNLYNGNTVLDADGEAWVEMPEWFDALNKEFRYQLTCIGGFANVYIAEEISGNRFKIAGGSPGLKVSWQVTGIRRDVYAEANRIPVEEDKRDDEMGKYLHPAEHGMPESSGIEYEEILSLQQAHEKQQRMMKEEEEGLRKNVSGGLER